MDQSCHQCHQRVKCNSCDSNGTVPRDEVTTLSGAGTMLTLPRYIDTLGQPIREGRRQCVECGGTAFDLGHVCCLVTDKLRQPASINRVRELMLNPSLQGDSRTIHVVNFGPLRERGTGLPLIPVLGTQALALSDQGIDEVGLLFPFPRGPQPPYLGFALIAWGVIREFTDTRIVATTELQVHSHSGDLTALYSNMLLSVSRNVQLIEIDRVFVGIRRAC